MTLMRDVSANRCDNCGEPIGKRLAVSEPTTGKLYHRHCPGTMTTVDAEEYEQLLLRVRWLEKENAALKARGEAKR